MRRAFSTGNHDCLCAPAQALGRKKRIAIIHSDYATVKTVTQ